jgi:phosphatidylglycerophosphatase C
MESSKSVAAQRVTVFDLDGTLTWHDTLFQYLTGFIGRHPARLPYLWSLPAAFAVYALADHDRGVLKSRAIRAAMGGMVRATIDAWSESFVAGLHARRAFRPTALEVLERHRRAGDTLVLLSASPDLYVPRIGRLLGFDATVCTELRWQADRLDGHLATPNRHGDEKRSCLEALRLRYPGAAFTAYGNSDSDLAHLVRADEALLVNGSGKARRLAAAAGIPVAEWT